MCDRHNKKPLDHYCLEHGDIICGQCATEEHAQTPCESMPLVDASRHIVPQLDIGMSELRKMKIVSQSILDGKRQEETLRMVHEAETLLDDYTDTLRKKLRKARSLLRPFTELSREERWKLKAVATKKIPNGSHVRDTADYQEARDLVMLLQEVNKQTKVAKEILNSMPNYLEVSISEDFTNSLRFEGNPILIKRKGEVEDSGDEMDESTSSVTNQETVYLIEKSSFTLERCTDLVIMGEYIIASTGDSVQKRDRKRMSFRQALTIPGAGSLCVIGETTEVSVSQKSGHINVMETYPNLVILYRLMIDKQYIDISYMESVLGTNGCPKDSPVFIVCHSNNEAFMTEYVDLIQPKPTRYPGNPPTFSIETSTIAESSFGKNKSRFRGVWSVCAFQNRHVIVGASKGVTCMSKTGNLIWTIDLYKQITQVMAYKTIIFVAVKDDRKILTIGNQGHVMDENILPPMDLYPQKMCAAGDTLMVKHIGQDKWIIFKKMYETVA